MCGRFVTPEIAEAERNLTVDLVLWRDYERSYNVAPTESVPVVRLHKGQREGLVMRWGMIPYFARGVPPKYSTINARVEALQSNACWRGPWERQQRCVLPALGFYEWHQLADGTRRPYFITCADQPLFWLAGLWDRSGETLSCTVITLPGNELLREIHNGGANPHRMPAILARDDLDAWLAGSGEDARRALRPYSSETMVAHPVSTRVNSPKNDDAELIEATSQS